MPIRTARPDDAVALAAIAEQAYELYVARMGKRPAPMDADFAGHIAHDFVLVYESDLIEGYVVVVDKPDHVLLENIAVADGAQGKGVGRALIAAVENRLRDRSVTEYHLYTNEKMTENLVFYPRLGFIETKRVEEDGFNRVYFVKHLE